MKNKCFHPNFITQICTRPSRKIYSIPSFISEHFQILALGYHFLLSQCLKSGMPIKFYVHS